MEVVQPHSSRMAQTHADPTSLNVTNSRSSQARPTTVLWIYFVECQTSCGKNIST
jgi:hypothetical protein